MTLSDAESNREANNPPAIPPTSDRSRLSSRNSGSQDDPGGEGPSLVLPLRRQELERRLQSSPADLTACIELAEIYRAAAMRRSDPAPPRVRLVAMRDAAEIAETLGLELSAQCYRRFMQQAETELNSSGESHPSEAPFWPFSRCRCAVKHARRTLAPNISTPTHNRLTKQGG